MALQLYLFWRLLRLFIMPSALKQFRHGFHEWLNDYQGLNHKSKWASSYLSVFAFYNRNHPGIQRLSEALRDCMAISNKFILTKLKNLAEVFRSGSYLSEVDPQLQEIRRSIEEELFHLSLKNTLASLLNI